MQEQADANYFIKTINIEENTVNPIDFNNIQFFREYNGYYNS